MSLEFKSKLKIKNSKLRVLIGTPVNKVKDYSLDRWIHSISLSTYPADLLLVDSSDDITYIKRLESVCIKYEIKNFKIIHIEIPTDANLDERLSKAREVIRQEILRGNYDAWFSWESDVLAPPETIKKLVDLLGDNWMVSHIYPARDNPEGFNQELGLTLISRSALEKIGFINEFGFIDKDMPDVYFSSDSRFIRQIDLNQKHVNVGGIIKPIFHLAK